MEMVCPRLRFWRFWATFDSEWVFLELLDESGSKFWIQNTCGKVKSDFWNRFEFQNANGHFFWVTLYIIRHYSVRLNSHQMSALSRTKSVLSEWHQICCTNQALVTPIHRSRHQFTNQAPPHWFQSNVVDLLLTRITPWELRKSSMLM